MEFYIWLVMAYEILANIQSEFARRAISAPLYTLSSIERKLWKDNSLISLLAMLFLALVRINGIAFLVYLGIQTEWWKPLVLWVACLVMTGVAIGIFRGPTGLAWPSLISFALLPILAIVLWSTL